MDRIKQIQVTVDKSDPEFVIFLSNNYCVLTRRQALPITVAKSRVYIHVIKIDPHRKALLFP